MKDVREQVRTYIAEQRSNTFWLRRVFKIYPEIERTEKFALPLQKPDWPERQEVKNNLIKLLPLSLILAVGVYMLLSAVFDSITKTANTSIGCLVLLAVFFLLLNFWVLKRTCLLVIDHTGITLRKTRYRWQHINCTLFKTITEGRNVNTYLVLLLTNGAVREININHINMPQGKLATAIEHYKTQATPSTTGN